MDGKIKMLSIGGLSLTPYFYEEDYGYPDNECLTCTVHVKLSQEQYTAFMTFMYSSECQYLPVIRHGISEDPIEMRFGNYFWSKDSGGYKVRFYLLNAKCDERRFIENDLDIAFQRNKDTKIETQGIMIDNLLDTLFDKGILNKDDILLIRETEKRCLWDKATENHEVDDVDSKTPKAVMG